MSEKRKNEGRRKSKAGRRTGDPLSGGGRRKGGGRRAEDGTDMRRGYIAAPSVVTPPSVPAAAAGGFTPAPGITMSGNFADGQTVIFTKAGGGFGARTNPKPLHFFPMGEYGSFDLGTDDTVSRVSRTLHAIDSNTFIQTAVKPANAVGACQYVPHTWPSTSVLAFSDTPYFSIAQNADTGKYQCYCALSRYWGFSATAPNNKFFRIWPTSGVGHTPDNYVATQPTVVLGTTENNPLVGGTAVDGDRWNGAVPHGVNQWFDDEHFYQAADVDVCNGIFNLARNSGLWFPAGGLWQMQGTVNGNGLGVGRDVYLEEFTALGGNPVPNGSTDRGLYTGIYVDDDFRQAVLTNEGAALKTARWGSGAASFKRIPQFQLSRSDTQIQLRVRLGSHAALAGLHLLVYTGFMTAVELGVCT